MGQQRGQQAQQQASKESGQQREAATGKRPEDPTEAIQELLGTRAASRQLRSQMQQAGESNGAQPIHSLLQSMGSVSPRSQAKPMFRGVSQEWGGASSGLVVQPKLMIGEPNDRYEQEADRVAQQVVQQMQSTPVAQTGAGVEVQRRTDEDEAELQRKSESLLLGEPVGGMAASGELEASIRQARGGGMPLPETVREPMERAFGTDFSGVRIHANAQADQLNRSISAKAFTTGQDVFVRQGAYQPGSREGQELLAHELTHVVQQQGGRVSRKSQMIQSSGDLDPAHPYIQSIARSNVVVQRDYLKDLVWTDSRDLEKDHFPGADFKDLRIAIVGYKSSKKDTTALNKVTTARNDVLTKPVASQSPYSERLDTLLDEIKSERSRISGAPPTTLGSTPASTSSTASATVSSTPTIAPPPSSSSSSSPPPRSPLPSSSSSSSSTPPGSPLPSGLPTTPLGSTPTITTTITAATTPTPTTTPSPSTTPSPTTPSPATPSSTTTTTTTPTTLPTATSTASASTGALTSSASGSRHPWSPPSPLSTSADPALAPADRGARQFVKANTSLCPIGESVINPSNPKSYADEIEVTGVSLPGTAQYYEIANDAKLWVVGSNPLPKIYPPGLGLGSYRPDAGRKVPSVTEETITPDSYYEIAGDAELWVVGSRSLPKIYPPLGLGLSSYPPSAGRKVPSVTEETITPDSYCEIITDCKLWPLSNNTLPSKYPTAGSYFPGAKGEKITAVQEYTLSDGTKVKYFADGKKTYITEASKVGAEITPDPIKVKKFTYKGDTVITEASKVGAKITPAPTTVKKFTYKGDTVITEASKVGAEQTLNYCTVTYKSTQYNVAAAAIETRSASFKDTQGDLFPAGGPKIEDIKQTNLGDCYLQSVMTSIAQSDPAHLQDMLRDNGDGTVTVRFYYQSGSSWIPKYIKVKKTVPISATGTPLYNDSENWARLLQKAFAIFAQAHGLYGDALLPPTAGYEGIETGVENKLYQVFYGPQLQDATAVSLNSNAVDPNSDLTRNIPVIEKLFEFIQSSLAGSSDAVNLSAGGELKVNLKRIESLMDPAVAGIDVLATLTALTAYPTLCGHLNIVKTNLADAIRQVPTPPAKPSSSTTPKLWTVIGTSKSIAEAQGTDSLSSAIKDNRTPAALQKFMALFELFNAVKEAGTDRSPNQRFVYQSHAYTIIDVSMKDTSGVALSAMPSSPATVDPLKSTIKLRNPHKGNVPTAYDATLAGDTTGKFEITLAQFLRNFSVLEYGRVRKTGV